MGAAFVVGRCRDRGGATASRPCAPAGRGPGRHRRTACRRRGPHARRPAFPPCPTSTRPLSRSRSSPPRPDRPFPGSDSRTGRPVRARLARVPATVIVGAQWGDEGKGKIVDLLAQDSDLVCRYQGGPNAGHTVVVGDETYKIRQIPTGVIAGKRCAIGAGCVVDPGVLIGELDELEARGHETQGLLFVSGNAHLVMPWHVALDGARERRLGRLQIGTTRRGIGPGLRGQGDADRDPRPGPARSEDPAPEARARRSREERLAPARLRARPVRRRGGRLDAARLRGAARAVRRRHVAPRRPGAPGGRARPLRGRAGDAARPRPRDVPVRHVVEPDRRGRGRELRDRAESDRRGARRREGVRHPCRRGPVPERDRRARPRARAVARATSSALSRAASGGAAGSISSRCGSPCA